MKKIILLVLTIALQKIPHAQTLQAQNSQSHAQRLQAQARPNDILLTIDAVDRAQTIDNIGASAAWFSEGIGHNWPAAKREQLAQWLFSQERSPDGSPKGIALSSFRFNIGGGTAEQGDSSGIRDFRKRVECFLQPDGTYDWTKQPGYLWFVKKAKEYGVENLIAFSNTPPVQFNQNGLGYKTNKDHHTNLRPDRYGDFAAFLATVLRHFDKEGIHFKYISPVNEPQWDWSNKFGSASQEGSPWHNEEIAAIVRSLDSALTRTHSTSKILITEAGQLDYLYGHGDGPATRQIEVFYQQGSPLQLNRLPNVLNAAGGHSYFTDKGDSNRIRIRRRLSDTARKYGTQYWQTEYSMLADGYKEGKTGKIPAIDCALFLAKVIHDDLVYGNAAAWQLWNSWEPGDPDFDTRYYLVALNPTDASYTDGTITATKNLWALGHYSRFIRPGMQRITVTRNDGMPAEAAAQNVMVSAFANKHRLVLVAINYTNVAQTIRPNLRHFTPAKKYQRYLTTADKDTNMKHDEGKELSKGVLLPPRSIMTIVSGD